MPDEIVIAVPQPGPEEVCQTKYSDKEQNKKAELLPIRVKEAKVKDVRELYALHWFSKI